MEKVFSKEWLGRTLTIKTGKFALQADAAVTVQYGDTVVLATAVEDKTSTENRGYFPLMVDMEEKLYAAGMIKGSQWIKREGRPSDEAVLSGRMVDRSIRPLFDQTSTCPVQVMMTVLSVDQKNDHDIVALIAASAALSLSNINWNGPIGGIRVGLKDGQFIFNPTYEERAKSPLDLIVAGTDKKAIMIEAGASEVADEKMYEAIVAGQRELQGAIELIKQAQVEMGIEKTFEKNRNLTQLKDLEEGRAKAFASAEKWLDANISHILFDQKYYTKAERKASVKAIKEGLTEHLLGQDIEEEVASWAVKELAERKIEAEVTRAILSDKKRVDGRDITDIRELKSEVGLLPRPHGTGLFSRGETQVLSVVTLGAAGLRQSLEGVEGKGEKRYMHHYFFPPYSVGEARPNRGAGRREIGHGALAEKALEPVLPGKDDFPYTIRVVSETMGSNGSSSMASTCGSTLALMDAGVPITKPVAGVAIGLASNEDMSQWQVLTDIQDLEDGEGGMDFKITGTRDGITAIQLDTKTDGLTDDIIKEALKQGYEGRLKILEKMAEAISESRAELSPYAPRITSFHIDPEKIREVIGAGGKVINEIIALYEVEIDIEDDGQVMVCGDNAANSAKAVEHIKNIVRELEPGEVFTGKVVRILDFGIFVNLTPGRDGMVHVASLANYRIDNANDVAKLGDELKVKIKEVDDQGRINLMLLGEPDNQAAWEKVKALGNGAAPRHSRGNGRPSGGRGGSRGGRKPFFKR